VTTIGGHQLSRQIRRIEHNDKLITYTEAAEVLNVSYATIAAMYSKGMTTIPLMREYRDEVENKKMHSGGGVGIVYETSRGNMTISQMATIHPYGLTKTAIRHRGKTWGFNHGCIWIDKSDSPGSFDKIAIELDGPPRPETNIAINDTNKNSHVTKQTKKINRLLCCLRDNGRERCVTYALRLKMYNDIPEPCKAASGNSCKNYNGKQIHVSNNCSGRGVRLIGPNGATMILR